MCFKKIGITFIYTFCIIFSIHAQEHDNESPSEYNFNAKNFIIEGEVFFNSLKRDEISQNDKEFIFQAKIGYFVTNNFVMGTSLRYHYASTTYNSIDNIKVRSKLNDYSLGIFARYYILKIGKRFNVYAQANISYSGGKSVPSNQLGTYNVDRTNFSSDLGINYFVTPKIAVSFNLINVIDYRINRNKYNNWNEFNLNLNKFNNPFDTPTFGLTFIL